MTPLSCAGSRLYLRGVVLTIPTGRTPNELVEVALPGR